MSIYQKLLSELLKIRYENQGKESFEEDQLLMEMDYEWELMSDQERITINSNSPKRIFIKVVDRDFGFVFDIDPKRSYIDQVIEYQEKAKTIDSSCKQYYTGSPNCDGSVVRKDIL